MYFFQLLLNDKFLDHSLQFFSIIRKRNKTIFSTSNCIKPNVYTLYNLYRDTEIDMNSYFPEFQIFIRIENNEAYFVDFFEHRYKLIFNRFIRDDSSKPMKVMYLDEENDFTYHDYILQNHVLENKFIQKIEKEYSSLNKIQYSLSSDILLRCMSKKIKSTKLIEYLIINSQRFGINLDYIINEKNQKQTALSKGLFCRHEILLLLIRMGSIEYDNSSIKTSIKKNNRIDFFINNSETIYCENESIISLLIKDKKYSYINNTLIKKHSEILNDFYRSPVIEFLKNIENCKEKLELFIQNGLDVNFTFFLFDNIYSLYSYLKTKKLENLLSNYKVDKSINHELYYNFLTLDRGNIKKEDNFILNYPITKEIIECISTIHNLKIDKNYYSRLIFRKIFINSNNYDIFCYISEFI